MFSSGQQTHKLHQTGQQQQHQHSRIYLCVCICMHMPTNNEYVSLVYIFQEVNDHIRYVH